MQKSNKLIKLDCNYIVTTFTMNVHLKVNLS